LKTDFNPEHVLLALKCRILLLCSGQREGISLKMFRFPNSSEEDANIEASEVTHYIICSILSYKYILPVPEWNHPTGYPDSGPWFESNAVPIERISGIVSLRKRMS
jgi:hypothetical protein